MKSIQSLFFRRFGNGGYSIPHGDTIISGTRVCQSKREVYKSGREVGKFTKEVPQ